MELLAASNGTDLSSSRVTMDIPMEVQTHEALVVASRDPASETISLDVEGGEAEGNPGLAYEVFLNVPEGANPTDPSVYDKHYVGTITFFGAHRQPSDRAEHGGPPGLRHSFDITAVVHALQAEGKWDPAKIKVTIEPLGLLPPAGGDASMVQEAARPTAHVGRISIYRH